MKSKVNKIKKLETGIKGLDDVLEGGVPKGRSLLIVGSTGTGKTVFLNEFLYRGIKDYNQNGVFVTFEERPDDIMKNVSAFGWNYDSLIKSKKLAFVDLSPDMSKTIELDQDYNLSPLIERIKYAIKKTNAKRVSIDTLSNLFSRVSNKKAVRDIIFQLSDELKKMGVTAMISAEKFGDSNIFASEKIQEFVADGVIELKTKSGQQTILREMDVLKLRGVGYRSGYVEFDITNDGLVFYPKIPVSTDYSKTDFKKRKKFGIKGLDEALEGGIPQGHITLLSGITGTGKTIIAMHFLTEGIKKGEHCIYVNLEEPREQIEKTAKQLGWNLSKYEKEGKLTFINQSLIDIKSDKILYDIVDAVRTNNTKRIVLDSLSSLESATYAKGKVREFLIQLYSFLKSEGVTAVLNYLNRDTGKYKGQKLMGSFMSNEMRLSSVIDGLIILDYAEKDKEIVKILNVLKLRGSKHSKKIHEFKITNKGVFFIKDHDKT